MQFFREGWNVFDFIVIGIAFLPGFGNNATIFRLARLARIVRVVHLLPDVRILITGVIRSLPPLGSMAILTTLILFVYGMVGWQLFSEDLPEQWGNIGEAMLTLFVMLTLEDFPQYMEAGMEIHSWSWVFFVVVHPHRGVRRHQRLHRDRAQLDGGGAGAGAPAGGSPRRGGAGGGADLDPALGAR